MTKRENRDIIDPLINIAINVEEQSPLLQRLLPPQFNRLKQIYIKST
jgi:hypothetical protein